MFLLDDLIALEPFKNRLLKLIGFQIKRVDDIMFALALMAAGCPRKFIERFDLLFRETDWFHHLAEHTICKEHCGHPIGVCKLERLEDHVHHLLDRRGRKYKDVEITVARGAGGLPVVCL